MTINSEIHKLTNSKSNKEKGINDLTTYKKGDKRDCSNYRGISLSSPTHKILSNILLLKLTPYTEEIIGNHQCGFDVTDQLLHTYSAFVKYLRKHWNTTRIRISYLQNLKKPMIQSVWRSDVVFLLSPTTR
jgi:hypothetical protein